MYTVIETPTYSAKVTGILTTEERDAVAAYVSEFPEVGSVVRGSGGVRKMRWARPSTGKSGGARIIYYNRLKNGEIWLLTVYAKGDRATIPAHEMKLIKETIEGD
jgi:hypothetical protein